MVKYIGRFYKVLILPRYPRKTSQKRQQTNKKALNQQITMNSTRKQDLNNNKTLIELSQQWRSLIITNRNR